MQNPLPNLDKPLLFQRNQVICLKNWKLWGAPTTIKFVFCWNFPHVSYLTMSTKGCLGFFYFVWSYVINKNLKHECVETSSFWFLEITQDLNRTKKIPNTLLQKLVSRKRVRSFSKKYWTIGSWSSSKFSILQTKNLASRKQ